MKMYQQTDKFLKKLKTKIRNEFNYYSTLSFDELNVIRVKQETKGTFDRLLKFNNSEYLEIIKTAKAYAETLLLPDEKNKLNDKELNPDDLLKAFLSAYNYVTGYLYEKEADRKRLRMSEEILTAREYQDRTLYNSGLQRTANLWYTQSGQYAIDIEDRTCLTTFKKVGIKKVMWVSAKDDRTCKVCRELDGQIFGIDNVPEKKHYNCRCTIKPYRQDNEK